VGALAREFVDFCARQDWHVCFYEVQPRHLPDYAPLGMQIVKIGEDAWIDLSTFTLIGATMADVRHAVNKSVRDGLHVHQLDPAHDATLWHQVQLIEAGWRAAQGELMIGFSIGRLAALADPETCYMLALGPDARRVLAYCTFRPIPAIGGWALDTMRRVPGAPNGALEFLIARSLEGFRTAGAAQVSLGLAPLAQGDAPAATRLDTAIRALANNPHVNAVYGYRGLLFFKRKFNPTWRGGYLLYPGVVSLPVVVAAVLQVHIPALGPQLAFQALRTQAVGLAARISQTRKRHVQVGAK
jgi:phosphatidylglycerol lysyltransferase